MKLQKKDVWKLIEKRRKYKGVLIYHSKKEVSESCRKMNQDVNRNRKRFWKEVSEVNEVKVECCIRVKDGNGRLAL